MRKAQLRARAIRWAIGKSALGTVFLIGALTYALSPQRHDSGNRTWMAVLVVLSTFHVGLGLRTFAKVHRRMARYWWVGPLVWGGLSTVLLQFLLRH